MNNKDEFIDKINIGKVNKDTNIRNIQIKYFLERKDFIKLVIII